MRRCTMMILVVTLMAAVISGCQPAGPHAASPQPKSEQSVLEGIERERMDFGRASIVLGMNKGEVLEQIALSRSQYEPLKDEYSGELFILEPSDEAIESDTWGLACPTRNSHVLGGGSGIMLELRFRDGRLVSILELPYLAG